MTKDEQQDVNTLISASIAFIRIVRSDWTVISEPPYDGQSQDFAEEWAATIAAAIERLSGEGDDDE